MREGLKEALKARQKAYIPYSKFGVGCAILLKNGTYVHGANIENISYGLTCCAERNGLFSLISQGYKKEDIKELFIIGDTGEKAISPCGACRQVILELCPIDTKITLSNLDGSHIIETTITELLPYAFDEFEEDEQ
ncbi:MAG: cytidine deaminase [Acholeplasmataceae bacterium]|jgi:cytidine deaminase